ncbi:MAG: LptF/LptG family permease [Planctomycetota bacterium]
MLARRAPITIWLQTTGELLRLIVSTTAVLVVLIAFAWSMRWVIDGTLGVIDLVRFVSMAMVPMLAYALPFAAGFGATLTFHRMSSDNELLAASAGGVGYRAMLAPGLAIGLTLATGLAVLNEQVIPRFLRTLEQMVADDLTKLMLTTIDSGEPLRIGGYIVSADSAIEMNLESNEAVLDSGVTDWLMFSRFMAIETDRDGRVTAETTAHRAHLFLFPPAETGPDGSGTGHALLHLVDAVAVRDGTVARIEDGNLPPIEVPRSLSDDPKFLTTGELIELRQHPERMPFVDSRRRSLARDLAAARLAERVQDDLTRQRRVRFDRPDGSTLILRARQLAPAQSGKPVWGILPERGAPIELELIRDDERAENAFTQWIAESAEIGYEIDTGLGDVGLALELTLREVSTGGDDAGQRRELVFPGLRLPDDPLAELLPLDSDTLVATAGTLGMAEHGSTRALINRIAKLQREITSKQHERAAMAVSCLVMVMCGSVLAIKLRDAMPLTVYLWSFFPALGCIISISSGQKIVHEGGNGGLLILWGGVAALTAYTAFTYRTVTRH